MACSCARSADSPRVCCQTQAVLDKWFHKIPIVLLIDTLVRIKARSSFGSRGKGWGSFRQFDILAQMGIVDLNSGIWLHEIGTIDNSSGLG